MNERFLLDTNVLSEFIRVGKPNEHVKQWLDAVPEDSLYVSVITLAEIQFGIELLEPSKRRLQLEQWMEREFDSRFAGRILPVDADIVKRWAVQSAGRQREGRPLAQFDGLIAATALKHGLTLATRDVRGFQGLGVTLFDPWETRNLMPQWPEAREPEPPTNPSGPDREREDDLDR
jgi:predicted nucleic acid-binding protein